VIPAHACVVFFFSFFLFELLRDGCWVERG